jgi:membrane dipeptidase
MLIVDAHLDLSWNAVQWSRDLQQSVYTLRTQESALTGVGRGQGTVAFPEMRKGRVALCFATLLARCTGRLEQHVDYASTAQTYAQAQGQLAYYHALAEQGLIHLITNVDELDQHMTAWQAWEADEQTVQPPLGFMISMESADAIPEPGQLSLWQQAGVRLIGPAHYGPGRYVGGTATELGFKPAGLALLQEMERLGIMLDLTHLSDQAFWQALEHFGGNVLASHNNSRALVPNQRQFDDEQLRAIIARDGVIGAAFDTWMVRPGWVRGARDNEPVMIAHVVDHIDHVCQLAGDSRHAALGCDLDGGFGREQSPADLDTIADLQQVATILAARGYSAADVAAIMHGNWLSLLHRVWAEN